MLFTDSAYIGIDPTSSHKSFTYAALDKDLNLIALADGEMEDVTAFVAGQKSATVAINAPAGVNRGLVREKIKKAMLAPGKKIRGAEFRVAEHELRERGISVSGTPASAALSSAWIQMGFDLYRKLEKLGFAKYPNEESKHLVLETHPHACYCVMIGQPPLSKPSLEGRLQRQLVLYERGLKIKDPMDFFEEITRHKMIHGAWPLELLYLPEHLDALVAAYTAWLVVNKPDKTTKVGDEREGWIILPEKELKEKY
jgi:predicted nuclease with RNAse H fold